MAATPENPIVKTKCVILEEGKQSTWFELTMRTLWTEGLNPRLFGCIGKLANIHIQKEEEDNLKFLAERDSLTHLYNQGTAKKRIREILSGSGFSAFLFLDFDDFKRINDTYGHMAGDSVLKQLANIISGKTSSTDIVARVGGDEFLIFLSGFADLKELKEQVALLWRTMQVRYDSQTFTVSAGVSIYPKDGIDYDTLFSRADTALYSCKKQGKNRYAFYK